MRTRLGLGRKPGADELAERIRAAVAAALPDRPLEVTSPDRATVVVSWHDGPAPTSVAGAIGDVPGWELAPVAPGDGRPWEEPDAAAGPTVWLDRSLSERALATAVVRFQASTGRPYSSGAARDRQPFLLICDADDPARSGYPLVDAMADLLLAEPAPGVAPERGLVTDADRLAWRLEAAGYDRLWAVAWSTVP